MLLGVVAPQNQGRPIREEIIPGLQRDTRHTDQTFSRWLALFPVYGQVLGKCCLACVSSVRAVDSRHVCPPHCHTARRHVSPPHCHTARRHVSPPHYHTAVTRLSSPLSHCTETRLSSPLSHCTETRLSSPLSHCHTARRHVSPPHYHTVTLHGDTSLLPTVTLQ